MPEKLCLFCQHFMCRAGFADSYGNGAENGMACTKKHNSLPYVGLPDNEDEFRALMMFAENCPDYYLAK